MLSFFLYMDVGNEASYYLISMTNIGIQNIQWSMTHVDPLLFPATGPCDSFTHAQTGLLAAGESFADICV